MPKNTQKEASIAETPIAPVPSDEVLAQIADGSHSGPHSVLGQHPVQDTEAVVIRVLRPFAREVVAVLDSGARIELGHIGAGVWQGVSVAGFQDYAVETSYEDAPTWTADDPYRYLPSVGQVDLHLFGEGRHERLWEMLGAHHRELHGVHRATWGTSFSVWAPHARAVRVIGDFNAWDGRLASMRRLDANGVWELFLPGLDPYNAYKFEILTRAGDWIEKADPMARHAEQAPATASVITESSFRWGDSGWLTARAASDPVDQPISVYEMHFGSWRRGLGYREAADQLIDYLHETGFTHVEFLPLAEHPYEPSWGYQVSGYYAPTSRFGHPDDLKYLIDRLHQARIGVYMDWVPGHFPKDAFALAKFDGEALYEHSDPRLGEHMDWGTLIPNFGDSQVRNFLVANALYWLDEFHVDGLRVDAVASMLYLDYSREPGQWVPNKDGGRENLEAIGFLQETTATAYKLHPGVVMMAEESTSWSGVTHPTDHGGLGFGLKWNMGWMNDSLRYIANDPMWRSHHQDQLTFSFVYAFSENFLLPISHDEVVHGKGSLIGKMPGDPWQQLANVRAYLAFQWAHPGKQLLFMGQEFGQRSEWSEQRGLDWWILDQPAHRALLGFVSQLNRVYRENAAFWQQDTSAAGFSWIDGADAANSVIAFLRWDGDGNPVACIFNFSGRPISDYRIGLPFAGTWEELLNSDAGEFGGSGVGNYGSAVAETEPSHGQPASVVLTLPPLGALLLKPKARR